VTNAILVIVGILTLVYLKKALAELFGLPQHGHAISTVPTASRVNTLGLGRRTRDSRSSWMMR
jgi:hypothetical protein